MPASQIKVLLKTGWLQKVETKGPVAYGKGPSSFWAGPAKVVPLRSRREEKVN